MDENLKETLKDFLPYAMHVSELKEKCPCPTLLRLALENGITLEELHDELWKLARMPEWEIKKYNVKPYQRWGDGE